ncbi:MAG: glycosyltransferase, partial [Gaiellaceae bacterium]
MLPHVGGVEQFVETARGVLLDRGCDVSVLACRLPGSDAMADETVPTRFLGGSCWPLPVGGWRTVWQEVQQADVVVANNARHVLPVLAILVARVQRKGAIFVVHGSGEGPQTGSAAFRVVRTAFQRTLARRAVRASRPVSVSRVGVESIRMMYGIDAGYLPYPLRRLPSVDAPPHLTADEPLRVVWVGRLFPEKDPALAVRAVERLREERSATLDVYGGGLLYSELAVLARSRTWLTLHGACGWDEIQEIQARAHLCLSTSAADNVQV